MGRHIIRFTSRLAGCLALACGALFYLPLGSRALWDSDEGRYAEIAREMLQLKDWVVPHLNYVVYLEKPPLMYWLTAIALRVFGMDAFAARFWCATFGLLTVLVAYQFGKQWRNERAGLLAGSILATSFGFFALTQFLVLDMALTFWTTLTLLAFSRLLVERSTPKQRNWMYIAALAIAGGLLTKGPIALILPLATLVAAAFIQDRRLPLSRIPCIGGAVLCALLVLPWFVGVSIRQPVFPEFFFIHEHVLRYLTDLHRRTAPWWFFVPVMLGGFLPWSVFLPKVTRTWTRHRYAALRRDPEGAMLVLWSLIVLVFFSFSQSKLVGYILPIFPALALLVASEFEEILEDSLIFSWVSHGVIALTVLFFGVLCLLKWLEASSPIIDVRWSLFVEQSGLLALLLGVAVFVLVGVWGMCQTPACLGGIMLVQVLLLTNLASVIHVLDPYQSTQFLAQKLQSEAQGQDAVIAYRIPYENVLQTLPFYLGRRVIVFGPLGELELGQRLDPDVGRWFVPEDRAQKLLLSMPAGTWGITDRDRWQELQHDAPPKIFHLVDRSGDLLLFRKDR